MKTLLVLRHAKSSWKESGLVDFERPLNARGKRASDLIGRFLRKKKPFPDLVLCSTATRARETVRLVLEAARLVVEVRYDQRLYLASADRLTEIVCEIEEDRGSVLLVGHNPGMEELIPRLTGETVSMPTAALAKIELDVDGWSVLSVEKRGRLDWLVKPKDLDVG
ncbi:MAG: histidine phosphatase family protein [Acidobacteriota bacterium]|nr:histidine phosphatase family protein [Acidobacteriota bacterium]